LDNESERARDTLSQFNIIAGETNQELMLFSKQIKDLENLLQIAKSKLMELLNQHNVETQQPKTLLITVSSRSEEAAAKVASEAAAEAVATGQEAAAAAALKAVAGDQETAVAAGQEAAAALKAVATDQEAAAAQVQSQILDCRTHPEALQGKIDYQRGIVHAFEELLVTAKSELKNLNDKSQAHKSTWLAAAEWHKAWKRHKEALNSQLRSMKSGVQRCSLSPSPVLAGGFNTSSMSITNAAASAGDATGAAATMFSSSSTVEALSVSPCPFCNRGFKPAWAALVVSCEHAYHIWCALTHFSSSTKCLLKDCQQEMHADFWRNTGIKMPTANANSNATADTALHALDPAAYLRANFLHLLDEEAQDHRNIVGGLDTSGMAAYITGTIFQTQY
jgi:hypothetical protein